ncbi:MAG: histidinol dehydrogenase [Flavobacteriaceae bacterium]
MTIIKNPKPEEWDVILKRPTQNGDALNEVVNDVFEAVQSKGDIALKHYTKAFDKVDIDDLKVSKSEVESAEKAISPELKKAIIKAKSNIETFHKAQKTSRVDVQTQIGVRCWQEKRPIESVGLYIPGGTAPLFSTVLMLAIPAQIAQCSSVVLCTPPNTSGAIANEILYTAALCGIENIYKVGGIQAIAGMTFGTATIPKVNKLFGPGNQYVTAAKQTATKFGVAIDMPAGPSELLVMADASATPAFVASDLLSQAEHGIDSQVVLVSTDLDLLEAVLFEVQEQTQLLSRKPIIEKALENMKLIYCSNKETVADLINFYGPEHYIISTSDNAYFISQVKNAGSVFIGDYTPESAGDYASGTNHTLPTNGFAKAYSGVNLDSFLKSITFQEITKEGLLDLGPTIELMAEAEGLLAHKNAVSIRLKTLQNGS